MNIYYFDPSLNCSLFFISLSLYLITLYLSLAFSIFTHYPLTHFLILPCSFLLPPGCLFHLLILSSISLHLFHPSVTFSLTYPPIHSSPLPHAALHHIHSYNQPYLLKAATEVPVFGAVPCPKCCLEIPGYESPAAFVKQYAWQHHHHSALTHHLWHSWELHMHPTAAKWADCLGNASCHTAS